MPRLPRFFAPATPQHIIQRGNNRERMFDGPSDFAYYKGCLEYAARKHDVAIHAYVLMTNHVHLLATPATAASLPRMMQAVGRVYVHYFNKSCARTGTLWEGRYKATIVDSEGYLLACMRYIELNPVRAGMATSPEGYAWSSIHANAYGAADPLVTPHQSYRELGRSRPERRSAYRSLLGMPLDSALLEAIREATQHTWALGSAEFRSAIDTLGRRSSRLSTGRPRKAGR